MPIALCATSHGQEKKWRSIPASQRGRHAQALDELMCSPRSSEAPGQQSRARCGRPVASRAAGCPLWMLRSRGAGRGNMVRYSGGPPLSRRCWASVVLGPTERTLAVRPVADLTEPSPLVRPTARPPRASPGLGYWQLVPLAHRGSPRRSPSFAASGPWPSA